MTQGVPVASVSCSFALWLKARLSLQLQKEEGPGGECPHQETDKKPSSQSLEIGLGTLNKGRHRSASLHR